MTKLRREARAVSDIVESESERLLRAGIRMTALMHGRGLPVAHVRLWPVALFDWTRMRAGLEAAMRNPRGVR